jgi:hypothetical protein
MRWAMTDVALTATVRLEPDGQPITLTGRLAWALHLLMDAGENGLTPLDNPGPRWSGYIHKLRTVHGLEIETVTESHGGAFPEHHASYILPSKLEILVRTNPKTPQRSNVDTMRRGDCSDGRVAP